jgi:hypothetical protein
MPNRHAGTTKSLPHTFAGPGSIAESELTSTCKPFVLGAVLIRSKLLEEIQGSAIHDVVMRRWRSVVAALSDCDDLVALGCLGRPPPDRDGGG